MYRKHEGDPILAPDTLLGWRPNPNAAYRVWSVDYDISVRTNSIGLRAPEPDSIPADARCRVLILGDSFTQGLTVSDEEMFAKVAERATEAATGGTCRVIPAGTEGHSTEQELLFFRRDLVRYAPTLTVLFFYYNDVWCNTGRDPCHRAPVRDFAFRLEDGELVWEENTAPMSSMSESPGTGPSEPSGHLLNARRRLNDHSELYALVRRSARLALGIEQRQLPFRSALYDRPLPRTVTVFRAQYDVELEYAWALTERLILELAHEAANHGSRFAVFHVPMRASVDPDEWNVWLDYQHQDAADWDPYRVQARLGRFCEEQRLVCVDPSDAFRDRRLADSTRLYLINDPHWSREGHRVVGHLLSKLITQSHKF